ncbi:hypothetical protein ACF9IK_05360 [Kitasatospora hibisci]|uniref:hypothetical protein n=1 Tax=Kitasatospora hibisci TaxID=3369522 RepID=UPI0037550D9F
MTVQSETATVNVAAPPAPLAGRRLSRRGVVTLVVTSVCLAVLVAVAAPTSGDPRQDGRSQAATSTASAAEPPTVAGGTPPGRSTGWTGGYRTVIPQGTAVDLGNQSSPAVPKWEGPNETFGWYGKADDGSEIAGYKDAAAFLPSDAPATRDACLAVTDRFTSGYAPHGFAPGDRACVFTAKNSNALITVVANTAVARGFDGQLTVDVLYGPAGL